MEKCFEDNDGTCLGSHPEISFRVSVVGFSVSTVPYPLSYRVPVRERYGSTLLPATREQHDQNCTQSAPEDG